MKIKKKITLRENESVHTTLHPCTLIFKTLRTVHRVH